MTTKVDTVKDSSAQQITENVTSGAHSENTENYSKNTEDIQEITEGMQENTGTASQNTDQNQEITEGIQENTEIISNSTQEVTENKQAAALAKPMYVFVPVDRFGDNKQETEPLKDLGVCVCVCVCVCWGGGEGEGGYMDAWMKVCTAFTYFKHSFVHKSLGCVH